MDDGVLKEKLEKLREPFPPELIGKLPKPTKQQTAAVKENFKSGIRCNLCGQWHHPDVVHLDYVGHAAITARLLDVDPNWNWEPLATTESGLPLLDGDLLWIRLTVLGQSRIGCGDAQGKVGPDAMKERIGDAIRNGAMRFGVALDLWHKGGELASGESFESIEAPPEEMIKRVLDGHSKGATVGEICRKLSLSERQVKKYSKGKITMWYSKEQASEKYPKVTFYGDAWIEDGVKIKRGVRIWKNVKIRPGAVIGPGAEIGQNVRIGPGVRIREKARINLNAQIGAHRKNVSDNLVIIGIGETKNITAFDCDDGLVITIGCMNDYRGLNLEETRKEIAKKYHSNHEYFKALELAEYWYKRIA